MTEFMPPIRILFPFVAGKKIGGSHISALKLISELDRSRFEPLILLHFLTKEKASRVASYISDLGLEYISVHDINLLAPSNRKDEPSASIPSFLFRTLPKAVQLLKHYQIDIVHTNDGRIHVNWSVAARLAGCRVLWHHREDPRSFGVNTLGPFVANRIVTVSEFSRPARPLLPISRRTKVIFSPFELPEIPDRDTARCNLLAEIEVGDNALLLGFFGSLVPRKRPLDFVRAVEAVTRALPDRDVRGLFFGDAVLPQSPLDRQAAELAETLGIGNKIHLMGFRRPIESIMSAVDVMLVTAENEPFGRTLIEGMHLGIPVIATEHGGNVEAIEHTETGLLTPLDDPEAMAKGVSRLESDSEFRARIVNAARQNLVTKYGFARHVAQIAEVYEELMSKSPRRAKKDHVG